MASIDTDKLGWEYSDKSSDKLVKEQNGEEFLEEYESLPLHIRQLYDVVNELADKVNIVYDKCITQFNIKDNPYKEGK